MAFKSAYGAGNRAGRCEPRIVRVGEHKYLEQPACPFPAWRFMSWCLWHEGYYNGQMNRLTTKGF